LDTPPVARQERRAFQRRVGADEEIRQDVFSNTALKTIAPSSLPREKRCAARQSDQRQAQTLKSCFEFFHACVTGRQFRVDRVVDRDAIDGGGFLQRIGRPNCPTRVVTEDINDDAGVDENQQSSPRRSVMNSSVDIPNFNVPCTFSMPLRISPWVGLFARMTT
jgi:hypothetical protein